MQVRWGFHVHSCDSWYFNASNPCLYVGGNYSQNQNHGLFYVNYNTATNTNANIGCRYLSKFEFCPSNRYISQFLIYGMDNR